MEVENLPVLTKTCWHHGTVSFPEGNGLTAEVATALSVGLASQRFHFLRKRGGIRLRTEISAADILNELVGARLISGWVGGIYEPETEAFGGPEGMDVAHDLFCADSRAALAEAAEAGAGRAGARERSVLLISAMLRAALLDKFEVGDVWAKVAAIRPSVDPPTDARRTKTVAAMHRLANADAAKLEGAEPAWAVRVAAFEDAGRRLRRLADDDLLTRGLRAVLAHHAIFTLNRAGLSATDQAALAWLAKQSAFADDELNVVPRTGSADTAARFTPMEAVLNPAADPTDLRAALVRKLTDAGSLRTQTIINAFQAVERHLFLPDTEVTEAYADDTLSVKIGDNGAMISAISQPTIVAIQLEQLDAQPGQTVLEAGAATGYNAALISRLVEPGGQVWTLDVDQDLIDGATQRLAAAGVSNVTPILGDGAAGLVEHAPYDRVIFTVGAGDIPSAVLDQLAPAGRLVIPLRIRGSVSRSIAFERDGDVWKSISSEMATFMPLRKGICEDVRTTTTLVGEGNVRLDTYAEQDVDIEQIATVLDQPPCEIYTGVKFRKGSSWEWLYLWLACTLPNGISRMPGQRPGFKPHFFWGSMATLDKGTLAYLTVREGTDADGRFWEIGVIGHGPRASSLADGAATAIDEWARDRRDSGSAPTFRMAVGDARAALDDTDPRFVIDKPVSRIVIDWP